MRIRFARSATKHRVSRERSRHVIEHCGLRFAHPHPGGRDRWIYVGDDADGVPLEVIAVQLPSGDLLVIHAMLLRRRYRVLYEEAKKWRSGS